MTMLSVIVPTHNRRRLLADAVRSIAAQTAGAGPFEVLIVDTASTDGTADTVANLRREFPIVRYLRAGDPGLHTGRHLGAREAAGEILVYVDDDIVTRPGWLEAIRQAFEDPAVAVVGGKSLPAWEGDVPWWVDLFRDSLPGGWTIGALSLIDLGDQPHDIAPEYVYGCNFSVRRDVLFSCGGFHPDSLPRELIARRGDGETALALAIGRAGHRARYDPEARLLHRVPPERLTKEYFRWRFYCQGISNSYAEVRRRHGMEPPAGFTPTRPRVPGLGIVRQGLRDLRRMGISRFREGRALLAEVERAKLEGFAFHQRAVVQDPALLRWVLKEHYF